MVSMICKLEKMAADRLLLQEAFAQGEKGSGRSKKIMARYLDQKFKDHQGREIFRHVGFLPEREIEEKLNQFGLI